MRAVFLDQGSLRPDDLDWHKLQRSVDLINYSSTMPEQVIQRCAGAEVIISNKVRLTAEHIESLADVKLICVAATGVNNVDLAAARRAGIVVTNVPAYSTESVVLYTFSLMLSLFSASNLYHQHVLTGAWQCSPHYCLTDFKFSELAGKTLVIVGHGAIGQRVAEVARAFLMNVIIAERPGATAIREGRSSFEAALKCADVLTLHCPLTAETENLIGVEQLALMKPSAYIINVARGGIINEQALAAALSHQEITGAALDVLTMEPPVNGNPLLELNNPNLIITPHVGWASVEARQRLLDEITLNISAFQCGEVRHSVL